MKKIKLTQREVLYIARITQNCNKVWDIIGTYGVDKIYGGTGAPTHEDPEIEEKMYADRLLQYESPQWIKLTDRIKNERKFCNRCGKSEQLQVHHIRYFPERKIWEYGDEHLELLCEGCHLKEHGLHRSEDGQIIPIEEKS